jgi:hypothetical protein
MAPGVSFESIRNGEDTVGGLEIETCITVSEPSPHGDTAL